MFKSVALLKAKEGLNREDLIAHYEKTHAPLILSKFPSIVEYRRNYCDFSEAFAGANANSFDFDIVTEIWFEDEAGYHDMLHRFADPEVATEIQADEEKFLDRDKTRMFIVDERASSIG